MSESLLSAGAVATEAAPTTTPAASTATQGGTAPAAAAAPAAQADGTPAAGASAAATTPNPEGKPASSDTAAEGAPETYADFTAPEGVQLSPELAGEFGTLAKSLNLSQENAQKMVDVAAKLAQHGAQAQAGQVQTIHDEWRALTTADKEFGGEKLAENLAIAKAAMLATTTPQLQMLLDRSGLGNNPEVIRHFLKIAPAFAPDKFVAGGTAPPKAGASASKVLYPQHA